MAPANRLTRRDFTKLSAAALSGVVAGSLAGCGGSAKVATAATEVHACRGLNECKGQGIGGGNTCAGQGQCATAVKHECAGKNECKHQGGCGEKPGYNECKGKGGCGVPMQGGMWESARKLFESEMTKAGKKFGAAPAGK
jgi:hypothetical protein